MNKTIIKLSSDCFKEKKELPNLHTYSDKMEAFLKNPVPGLGLSYQEVIEAIMNEGFDVYIQGGLTRDLPDDCPLNPHDVDLYYTGNPTELIQLLNREGWTYTKLPDRDLITIGEKNGVRIDASPVKHGFLKETNQLEYTVSNIIYHFNSKKFLPQSEVGLVDSMYKRLRVVSSDLHGWLYDFEGLNYKKIFRFWKMVGKGFVYGSDFEQYIRKETLLAHQRNSTEFSNKLINFLSKNNDSMREISQGCIAVMGQEWYRKHIVSQRPEIERKELEFEQVLKKYTYNSSVKDFDSIVELVLH